MKAEVESMPNCSLKRILSAAGTQPLIVVQDAYNRDVLLSAFEQDAHIPQVSVFVLVLGLEGANSRDRVLPQLIAASQKMGCEAVVVERFDEERIRRACDLPEEVEVCAVLGFDFAGPQDTSELPENIYLERFGAHSFDEAERPSKAGGPMQSSLKCCGE